MLLHVEVGGRSVGSRRRPLGPRHNGQGALTSPAKVPCTVQVHCSALRLAQETIPAHHHHDGTQQQTGDDHGGPNVRKPFDHDLPLRD